ncbi:MULTISPECIES: hypothetical protein [Nostocales]|uniref:Uncharacterized protein n=3 Tax=Nostocales TaxID=1161 RepID=A0A0C1QRA0_9CYAN|nr:hypothetical protein [Tolypothrix bouteillei]KAF3888470.1 hypothetical protein DA73_0400025545 [Tolypothrix bouteillei VB521301]
MQHLSKLLEIENSNLAWVLRLGLHGLRTQLQEALKMVQTDPGNMACEELLRELDVLLQSVNTPQSTHEKTIASEQDDASWEDVLEPVAGELKLRQICEALLVDRELSNYIGQYEFYSTSDADLWNEIQRLLLRVPEKLAHTWREYLVKALAQVGAVEDKELYLSLPFTRHECIYPGLGGKVKASGLWFSDRVDFDSRLMVERSGGELDFLAGVVSICLQFIESDPLVHHALKSVDRFGIRSLSLESEKSKYVTALIDRFRRVQATADNSDSAVALRARLDLDEAIHSLVYLPCSDRFSWWGKLQQETRRTLDLVVAKARQAGHQVQIRPLWGIYADVFNWSKDDLQLDIGGVPGEVSACLRVYAKIDDELLPGRVLFRSS